MIFRKLIYLMNFLTVILIIALPLDLLSTNNNNNNKPATYSYPAHVIKFSPLALFEIPQPSLQIAYEYRINPTFYLQHELGWLPAFRNGNIFDERAMKNGGKIKTELRYYIAQTDMEYKPNRNYLALEGLYRIRVVREEGWQRMNGGTFSQWVVANEYRQQYAFHIKFGHAAFIFPPSPLNLDFYIGFGLRRYFLRHYYITEDVQGTPDFARNPYNFIAPSLALGVKLCFGIK